MHASYRYVSPDGRRGGSSFKECLDLALQASRLLFRSCFLDISLADLPWTCHDQVTPIEGCEAARKRHLGNKSHDDGGHSGGEVGSGRCLIHGVMVPELTGSRFLAVENLFWTARALGLSTEATLKDLHDAGEWFQAPRCKARVNEQPTL